MNTTRIDALDRFAQLSGAEPEVAQAARGLFGRSSARLSPREDAEALLAQLRRAGFEDHPSIFRLDTMLERRAGSCFGLTLLIGAALTERGHLVRIRWIVNPRDAAREEAIRTIDKLVDEETGFDYDERLPDAGDESFELRMVPAEHIQLELSDWQPFEVTSLGLEGLALDRSAVLEGEHAAFFDLQDFLHTTLIERSRALARAAPDQPPPLSAWRLAMAGVRGCPNYREGWGWLYDLVEASGLGRQRFLCVAGHVCPRYLAFDGPDALFAYRAYRMTGEPQWLSEAQRRFPAYAEARLAALQARQGTLGEEERVRLGRELGIVAWALPNPR